MGSLAIKMPFAAALAALMSAAAAPPPRKPMAPLPPPDAGAALTFNEEFDRLSADPAGTGGWTTTMEHGNRTLASNHEAQLYTDATLPPSPFRIEGGQLQITAANCAAAAPLPYCSGVLTSRTMFTQRYGYFEMRARLPVGRGLWPAFWLLPSGGGWPPEIDVMEALGQKPDTVYASVHWKTDVHHAVTNAVNITGGVASFHVYGLSWHPDRLRWYVDGAEVASLAAPPGLDRPMYLLVNLAVGGPGSWPGPPDAATRLPATIVVDYVRAYGYAPP